MRRGPFVAVSTLIVVLLGGTAVAGAVAAPTTAEMVDGGSWYSREQWPHDGHPYESEHFVVFSDAASQEARVEAAEVAEEVWQGVLAQFGVDPTMLGFPEGQDGKVHIYAYHDHSPQDWGMRAYWAGLIMWSPDHPRRPNDRADYEPVVRHELVHVLESLLLGREFTDGELTEEWFSEGIAETAAGGTAGGAIRSLHQLDSLTDQYGDANPVSFTQDPIVDAATYGYDYLYPTYQLATEYLFDEDGLDRSLHDARDLWLDMSEGSTFAAAFASRMGIDRSTYEDTFFARMDAYLPTYRTPLVSPAGFAAFAALVVLASASVLVVSYRRLAPSSAGDRQPLGASFLTEEVLTGIVAVAFFLGIWFAVSTATELNNAMESGSRSLALAVLIAYLVGALGLLVLALRQRIRGSRSAYLIAPAVLALTGITFLALAVVL